MQDQQEVPLSMTTVDVSSSLDITPYPSSGKDISASDSHDEKSPANATDNSHVISSTPDSSRVSEYPASNDNENDSSDALEERAVRFLLHPSISDLSRNEKLVYLEEKCGFAPQQMQRVLQKLKEQEISGGSDSTMKRLDGAFQQTSSPQAAVSTTTYQSQGRVLYPNVPTTYQHGPHRHVPPPYSQHPYASGSSTCIPPHTSGFYPQHQAHDRNYPSDPAWMPYASSRYLEHNPDARTVANSPNYENPPIRSSSYTGTDQERKLDTINNSSQVENQVAVPISTTTTTGIIELSLLLGGTVTMLGMAGWRWLNGGDFELLPPPRVATKTSQQQQRSSTEKEKEKENEEDFVQNEIFDDEGFHDITNADRLQATENEPIAQDNNQNRCIASSISDLAASINSLRNSQELAAKKRDSALLTNSAMDELRKSSHLSDSAGHDSSNLGLQDMKDLQMELKSVEEMCSFLADTLGKGSPEQQETDRRFFIDKVEQVKGLVSKLEKKIESEKGEISASAIADNSNSENVAEEDAASSVIDVPAPGAVADNIDLTSSPQLSAVDGVNEFNAGVDPSHIQQQPSLKVEFETTLHVKENEVGGSPEGQSFDQSSVEMSLIALSKECDPLLAESLNQLIQQNKEKAEVLSSTLSTIQMYAMNIVKHPSVAKYRKVYTNNEGYRRCIEDVPGAIELLHSLGFTAPEDESKTLLEWREQSNVGGAAEGSIDIQNLSKACNELKLLKQEIQQKMLAVQYQKIG